MKTECRKEPSQSLKRQGFTLIEVAAIIVILAALSSLVVPALAKGNARSHVAICLNNHRQLVRAWALYAKDFDDRLANNYPIPETESAILARRFDNWANNIISWAAAGIDGTSNTNLDWLAKGLLGPYLGTNLAVYKCPSDVFLSPLQGRKGWTARVRSVSMNAFLGRASHIASEPTSKGANYLFPNYRQFLKLSEIPQPSSVFVTLDEHPDSINDGYFMNGPDQANWQDIPGSYHNGAGSFSFADEHFEFHKWSSATSRYPVRYFYATKIFDDAGRRDFQWYRDRVQYIPLR